MAKDQRLTDWEDRLRVGLDAERLTLDPLQCFEEVGSTMDVARALLAHPCSAPVGLVLAQSQVAGRGRQGRVWQQAADGFHATFLIRSTEGIAKLSGFSLVVGCAVSRFCQALNIPVLLKWPNDIMSHAGEKLGGVLIEIVSQNSEAHILTGVGINLRGEPDIDAAVTSLHSLSGKFYSPVEVASGLTPILLKCWRQFSENGFAPFKAEWQNQAFGLNRMVSVDAGEGPITGILRGISDTGALLVESKGELRQVISGHVTAL